ncbi:hypothetical protein C8J57DRAFT_1505263 [Mycena rebaudengoi]|nr:hypothetical protein C8J57DRAFT_1505263 [Mycena rebaudengoi]
MLAHTSTQQVRPATEALARRIRCGYPKDYLVDFGAAITVLIWTGKIPLPVELILFPREDGPNALLIHDMEVEGEIEDFEIYARHLS